MRGARAAPERNETALPATAVNDGKVWRRKGCATSSPAQSPPLTSCFRPDRFYSGAEFYFACAHPRSPFALYLPSMSRLSFSVPVPLRSPEGGKREKYFRPSIQPRLLLRRLSVFYLSLPLRILYAFAPVCLFSSSVFSV